MRSSLALIATAALVAVALSGCAAQAPAPEAAPGGSSDTIDVTGDFGTSPEVEFPTPLMPEETECTEIVAGEGPYLEEGQLALTGLAVYNGATGDEIQVTGFGDEEPIPLVVTNQSLTGLKKGLTCAREGSRVAVVVPEKDAFGPNGNPQIGVNPGDSLVFVIDVQRAFPSRADGSPRLTRDGFPAVVLAPDGRPGITVPKSPAPEQSEVETLKAGSGEVVEEGDQVVVQYTAVDWESNEVTGSTWEDGAPVTAVAGDGGQGGSLPPAVTKELVGQKAGSQIGVIVAPEGDDASGSAQFYVVDILGVL
ncbi:FKBP-type peptidyl-prolyl cis-trans isomerase [Agromyces sp. S2-1-8]|uniref:FKBP-type peptidyl-prolyl cis-trans isomerase n=1 Tax=Agromyces sp. S2-1-8 TaxID=2897180 RepID=UPI001E362895|nr:FKBP-type peptidyl-prolyl cis-trans isomerase [Agromyces sp. S2-1-8]MCD5347179.1 hypothetical protein [Agromyces sp. S2-1-8]